MRFKCSSTKWRRNVIIQTWGLYHYLCILCVSNLTCISYSLISVQFQYSFSYVKDNKKISNTKFFLPKRKKNITSPDELLFIYSIKMNLNWSSLKILSKTFLNYLLILGLKNIIITDFSNWFYSTVLLSLTYLLYGYLKSFIKNNIRIRLT